jgi:hypothetical protein
MSARKNPPLAYCEYVTPGSEGSTAVSIARDELMRAVHGVFPVMLERLSTHVLPGYRCLAESGFNFGAILWNDQIAPHKSIPDSLLKNALREWAAEFNCDCGWFLDDTLRTLRGWYVAPDWLSSLRWHVGRGIQTVASGKPIQFDCEGWEMQALTWENYRRSARERFEKKLAEYEAAARDLAESKGLVRAPRQYSSKNLEWFVLYQFAGHSSTQIANRDSDGGDESTVLKGVKAAAKHVGWTSLRPARQRPIRKTR